ncbi:hypothetical protein LOTGIDRAFT_231961 [Lottia gigantea]|uniref:Uncharacterized protein n=1 Tax=Lottia gigantea TaxID=225164 RepID=V3ZW84_LOTGI|nr:hypothetical protein LOTGIDRAFT_231961 [Lottia gigantea]ESO95788.1 hypothetical protein LOTGIDRAFT_231961 [Lottia gigantea]
MTRHLRSRFLCRPMFIQEIVFYFGYYTYAYRTEYKLCSAGCCSYGSLKPCCADTYTYTYTSSSSSTLVILFKVGGSIGGVIVFFIIICVIFSSCKKKTRVTTRVTPAAATTVSVSTTQNTQQIGQGYPYPPSGNQSNPVYLPPNNLPGQPSYGEAPPLPPKYDAAFTSFPH